jgi:hypothetical protein
MGNKQDILEGIKGVHQKRKSKITEKNTTGETKCKLDKDDR